MKKIFLSICILLSVHAVAKAQLSITPHIGTAFPVGTFNSFTGTGLGFGLEATYALNDNLRVGVAVDRYQFDAQIPGLNLDVLGIKLLGNTKFNVTPITGTVQYILPGEVLRPYIGLEAGVYNFSINKLSGINRSYYGLAPTVGVLYPINDRLDFFANTKFQTVFVDENISIGDFSMKQNIYFIPVNVGVSFNFDQ